MEHRFGLISAQLASTALVLAASFGASSSAPAAILVRYERSAVLPGGLVQYVVSATSTQGEIINTFSGVQLSPRSGSLGVHQVWNGRIDMPTPTKEEHHPLVFNSDWVPYDTHFLYDATQALGLGPSIIETNDASTTSSLGLSSWFEVPPKAGFGQYSFPLPTARVVTNSFAGTNVPFLQVVMRDDDVASLKVRITANGGGSVAHLDDFQIADLSYADIRDLDLGTRRSGEIIAAKLPQGYPCCPSTWLLHYFTATGAIVDPNTGEFRWDSTGAAPGKYEAILIGHSGDVPDSFGRLTFRIVVPEPSTVGQLVIITLWLSGPFARRRHVMKHSAET